MYVCLYLLDWMEHLLLAADRAAALEMAKVNPAHYCVYIYIYIQKWIRYLYMCVYKYLLDWMEHLSLAPDRAAALELAQVDPANNSPRSIQPTISNQLTVEGLGCMV